MVGFHNLLLKWIIVQCVQYGNDTILEYQWPVALFMAYHETYDKKMSLFICCATLSRLLVLLYRWRSGHTFTPGFSKYVKFVICVRFLCSKTNLSKGRCLFFFYLENPGINGFFHFEADPLLRFFPRTRCQYHRVWWYTTQHSALAQKPQSGNMLCSSSETWGQSWKTSVLFHNVFFFSCLSLQCRN